MRFRFGMYDGRSENNENVKKIEGKFLINFILRFFQNLRNTELYFARSFEQTGSFDCNGILVDWMRFICDALRSAPLWNRFVERNLSINCFESFWFARRDQSSRKRFALQTAQSDCGAPAECFANIGAFIPDYGLHSETIACCLLPGAAVDWSIGSVRVSRGFYKGF